VQDTALGGAIGDQLMYSYGALSIAAQQQIQQRIQAMTQAKAVLEPLGKWPNPPIDLDYQKQAQEAIAAKRHAAR